MLKDKLTAMTTEEYEQYSKTGSNEPAQRTGGTVYRKQTPEREIVKRAITGYGPRLIILPKTGNPRVIKTTPSRLDKYYKS